MNLLKCIHSYFSTIIIEMKKAPKLITLQYLENLVVEAEKKDLKNQKYNQLQDCLYNSVLFENDILNNQD